MSTAKSSGYFQSLLFLIAAMISIQSSGSLAKMLFQHFPVLTVAAMRILLGALILIVVFRAWRIHFHQVRWSAVLSYGCALAGMNILFYSAISRLPLGIAVSFEFVGPLGVALYYARQKFDLIWVCLAILGIVLLFPMQKGAADLDLLGVAYALTAGACWALYIVAGKKPSGVSGPHTVCLGMLVGAIILLPFLIFSPALAMLTDANFLLSFFALAVLASALPFSFEMIALRNMSSLSFGTLTSLEPAIAALSGLIFLGEHLQWNQYLALLTIVSASIGCTITSSRVAQRKKKSDPPNSNPAA
ncbi:EamA family transporter [Acinetobacter larvae]|uniref:EamA family transporter n=1 Tax=Acinetobacter larvae TaxID=1789224 RepID=A0A1B2LW45_9GAMM|nr:DMT family transporter [Acinetobacter larvae]AOA57157.1 EamA family transporter [Acinetobacter larvae]